MGENESPLNAYFVMSSRLYMKSESNYNKYFSVQNR